MDVASQVLKTVPLFAELADEDLALLAETKVNRQFPRNATIINDGDTTNAIYLILKGRVKVCKTNEEGREVVLSILDEGEHFGEMSLLDDKPRSASIVTKEPCEFMVIRKEDFQRVLIANPQLALRVMQGFCERLRAADRNIESLALLDVYGRIARVLLDMAETEGDNLVIKENLTHKDIAQMVGSSREMVSRIFKDLEKGGYISKSRSGITINTNLPHHW